MENNDSVELTQDVYGPMLTPIGGWPWNSSGNVTYYYHVPTEPTQCIGKAHVFECEHVVKCKCGAIKRVMPRAKKDK